MDTKAHEWEPTTRRTIQNDRTFVSVRVHSWFKLSHYLAASGLEVFLLIRLLETAGSEQGMP